jgi:hypothetical protein
VIIEFYKTKNLSEDQQQQIRNLFMDVFNKSMSFDDFQDKFYNNIKGYSYHSVLINEQDMIVGCYSCIPYEYNYFGNKLLFGLSVDTMIQEKYRGNPFTLKKLANKVYSEMVVDGVSFVFGFPNESVYFVRKKILKWEDIGSLKYYFMPLNMRPISTSLKSLNIFIKLYSKLINRLVKNEWCDNELMKKNITKVNDDKFIRFRYNKTYTVIKYKNGYFAYKVYNEGDVKTAFLLDVYPMVKCNLEYAVKVIYNEERNNVDMILYIGHLDFGVMNLIEVPKKYEPKSVRVSGKILDVKNVDSRIFDIIKWDVNLSNYDVR